MLAYATGPAQASELDSKDFPRPDVLRPNIDFWTRVYSVWTSDQGAFHDERHPDVVYEVVDLEPVTAGDPNEAKIRKRRRAAVDRTRDRIEAALRRLSKREASTDEERRIVTALSGVDGGREKYGQAVRYVRLQTGLKNRFAEAVVVSGRYMRHFEEIFEAEGIPAILSRLPFVESMFVSRAHSKVGAVGMWQFMPATARLYMQMTSAVDSRLDPLLAAKGAARMLRHDHEDLQTWPLALTAYNHGRGGMRNAVKQVGTRDIGAITQKYRSRRFGFASRNFYSEFLAAADVYADRARHFPGSEPAAPLEFEGYELPRYVSLLDLARGAGLEREALEILNPGLNEDVFTGTMLVPRGYVMRVPRGTLGAVRDAYAAIPEDRRRTGQLQVGYRVEPGDTVGVLARRFSTSIGAIQRANNLSRPDRIFVGQYLRIPGQSFGSFGTGATAPRTASSSASNHVVRPSENLSQIARRYGRSVETLVAANGLPSPDLIAVGQNLDIPALGGDVIEARSHVVRRGNSLTQISRIYGVSVDELRSHNELRSSVIHPGQVLVIP